VIVPPTTQSAHIAIREEQTPEEMIAEMDSKLGAGLSDYDERLLREQERIKAATPNENSSAGSDGGAGDGDRDDSLGVESESDTENESDPRDSRGMAGDVKQSEDAGGQSENGRNDAGSGAGTPGNDSDVPTDIPDGSDDDIVARQLREAAENETDPELKAKLWQEYRRYKRGTT
jgi:hypothetical protein